MPTPLPNTVREAWGEEAAGDFSRWFEEILQQRTVHRDEYREVLSRLDVLEERFNHVDERFDHLEERFDRMEKRFNKRFERVDERFVQMTDQLDRMNGRILSMTRWLIGLLVAFGTLITALLAIAQFTA